MALILNTRQSMLQFTDDKDPENISMEEALVLIAARIAYDESKSGKKTRKKSKKSKTEDE